MVAVVLAALLLLLAGPVHPAGLYTSTALLGFFLSWQFGAAYSWAASRVDVTGSIAPVLCIYFVFWFLVFVSVVFPWLRRRLPRLAPAGWETFRRGSNLCKLNSSVLLWGSVLCRCCCWRWGWPCCSCCWPPRSPCSTGGGCSTNTSATLASFSWASPLDISPP